MWRWLKDACALKSEIRFGAGRQRDEGCVGRRERDGGESDVSVGT